MSASLVGSEMCIRDRCGVSRLMSARRSSEIHSRPDGHSFMRQRAMQSCHCLLYTSDAADDM
eukprot:8871511-Alexandrium_andersonii.AAC.1